MKISRKLLFIIIPFVLFSCSVASKENTDENNKIDKDYLEFFQKTDEAQIYKSLAKKSCKEYAQARIDLHVICFNLDLLEMIPNDDINVILLPYAKKSIARKHLSELSKFYGQQEIKDIGGRIQKGIDYVTHDELKTYNKISNTEAGKEYSMYISNLSQAYLEVDKVVTERISEMISSKARN